MRMIKITRRGNRERMYGRTTESYIRMKKEQLKSGQIIHNITSKNIKLDKNVKNEEMI